MSCTRRDFLIQSAFGLTATLLPGELLATPAAASTTEPLIVGASQALVDGKRSFVLIVLKESGQHVAEIPLPFHMHGFAAHPQDRHRAVLFEKQGPGACEVDLRTAKVTRPVQTTAQRRFYGHGCYSPKGDVFYATESFISSDDGVIVVRDAHSLAALGQVSSHGVAPHDCRLIDGGKVLVVTHNGGRLDDNLADAPSVSYVELASGKLLDKLRISNAQLNAGHLELTSAGELVVISAPRKGLSAASNSGGVSMRHPRQALHTLEAPAAVTARMLGETLSVAVDEKNGVVAATNPDGNIVTFWDLFKQRFLGSLDMVAPRGVLLSADGQYFAISNQRIPVLSFISTKTLRSEGRKDAPDVALTGSHLYRHRL